MKIQAIKYGLILLAAICFVGCNSSKKKENYTSLKFERLIRDADDYEKILHHDLLIVSENDSIINPANGEREKLSILRFNLLANADDSILIFFENSKELKTQSVFQFLPKEKKWSFYGYTEKMMKRGKLNFHFQKNKSSVFYYKLILEHQIQDSMMFRYYFKTSQFKDSLMWHDVYYTFKNDSFIIIRQTENEK